MTNVLAKHITVEQSTSIQRVKEWNLNNLLTEQILNNFLKDWNLNILLKECRLNNLPKEWNLNNDY